MLWFFVVAMHTHEQMLESKCLSNAFHTASEWSAPHRAPAHRISTTGRMDTELLLNSAALLLLYVLALAESYKVRTFGINVRPLNCKKAWDCWFYEFIAAKFCQHCIMSQYQLPQFTFVWGWLMCVWKYGKYLSDTIVLCADIGAIKDQNCFIIILSLYNYLFDFHTWIYLRMTQNL